MRFARHQRIQFVIVELLNGRTQRAISVVQLLQSGLPGGFARVHDRREVHLVRDLADRFTLHAAVDDGLPGANVIDEFPDAVCVSQRMLRGLRGSQAVQQFPQGRAVPSAALMRCLELNVDAMCFRLKLFLCLSERIAMCALIISAMVSCLGTESRVLVPDP